MRIQGIKIAVLAALISATTAHAGLSEPSNVLYGAITLDNSPVTATRTDVIIQARRSPNGAPIATYRMGSNSRVGDFYSLEIPIESLPPINDAASQVGGNLVIILLDATGPRAQINYVVGERGQIQRVDFGAALADSDGDDLPDAWEMAHFGNLNQSDNSLGQNGLTLMNNFVLGIEPSDTINFFKLGITRTAAQATLSFFARRSEGTGYDGYTRYYTIESAHALTPTNWAPIFELEKIPGNNQTIQHQISQTNSLIYYRGRIWLE